MVRLVRRLGRGELDLGKWVIGGLLGLGDGFYGFLVVLDGVGARRWVSAHCARVQIGRCS